MLITLIFSVFPNKKRIRKGVFHAHTACLSLRTCGASRTACLTIGHECKVLTHLHCKTHSPPLQGFARFAFDGIIFDAFAHCFRTLYFNSLCFQHFKHCFCCVAIGIFVFVVYHLGILSTLPTASWKSIEDLFLREYSNFSCQFFAGTEFLTA